MKKNRFLAVCVIFAGTSVLPIRGDVILPGTHVVERCVKIDNVQSFPDIVLLGVAVPPGGDRDEYVVKSDSCLTKGYKFNRFYLCWTSRDLFDSLGLENLPIDEALPKGAAKKNVDAQSVFLLSSNIEPYGGAVPDSNPLVKEYITYSLQSNGSGLGLGMVSRVEEYQNGTTKEIELSASDFSIGDRKMSNSRSAVTPIVTEQYLMFTSGISGNARLCIRDCRGRTVVSKVVAVESGATYTQTFSNLSSGIYWIDLTGLADTWRTRLNLVR